MARRVHNIDIRDRSHVRAEKINLGALLDSRSARFRQTDSQSDIAPEPTLAALRPHNPGNQQCHNDQHERAGNLVDVPKSEARFQRLPFEVTS